MVYYDTAKVKRYIREVNSTSKKNPDSKRKIETVQIGLSKFSKFEDGEDVVILRKSDFEQLQNTNKTTVIDDDLIIRKQLTESNAENTELKQQLVKLESNIKSEMNKKYLSFIEDVESLSDDVFQEVSKDQQKVMQQHHQHLGNVADSLQSQVKLHNDKLSDASWFKLWRYRDDFNLVLPSVDLKDDVLSDDILKSLDICEKDYLLKLRKLKDDKLSDFKIDALQDK